jgi:hypothetical protein
MLVGALAIIVFYVPAKITDDIENTLIGWAQVLAAAALILGGINIVQVNYPKIRRREKDWQYKAVLLGSAAIMLLAGIPWHKLLAGPPQAEVVVQPQSDPGLFAKDMGRLVIDADDRVMVSVDGGTPVPAVVDGQPTVIEVRPGEHSVRLFSGSTDFTISGYSKFDGKFEIAAGQTATASGEMQMKWGPEGRAFKWLYDHVFAPCNATMFALLAFFIASAAFRAFRARNVEAALLLGAAILVMLGRVPIGRLVSESFPYIADWLVDVPNNAGRRAIMMGAALGAVATGLRVILGLERSHLGAD